MLAKGGICQGSLPIGPETCFMGPPSLMYLMLVNGDIYYHLLYSEVNNSVLKMWIPTVSKDQKQNHTLILSQIGSDKRSKQKNIPSYKSLKL